jgi:replication factor C subunit 3/5
MQPPKTPKPKNKPKTKQKKIRVETKPWTIELPSRKLELELTSVSSNYHVELSPGDAGGSNDRFVVQEVIKDLAKNRPLDVATGARVSVVVFWFWFWCLGG